MFNRTSKHSLIANIVLISALTSPSVAQTRESLPKLLSVREQQLVRESWLKKRLDTMLLMMMRQQKIDMWIVVNEEFHADPVTAYIAPPLPYAGRREFFIFSDRGGDKLDRVALVRYGEEHLKYFFEVLTPPGAEIASTLRRIVDERKPKTNRTQHGRIAGRDKWLDA
jgi:hypothetical protein